MGARRRRIARSVGVALAAFGLGCGTHLTLAPDAQPRTSTSSVPGARPLLLELVESRKDGLPQSLDEGLTNRVAMALVGGKKRP